jgi:ABC-type transporter Mla MlaB component
MSRAGPLRIDLAASGPYDVSGLQLLLSVLRTPRTSGDPVRLARVPRVLFSIAERAGVADVFASPDVVESLA